MIERTPKSESPQPPFLKLYTSLVSKLSKPNNQVAQDTYQVARYVYAGRKKPDGIVNIKFEADNNAITGYYQSEVPDVQNFVYVIRPDGAFDIALPNTDKEPWASILQGVQAQPVFSWHPGEQISSPIVQKYIDTLQYALRSFCFAKPPMRRPVR